MTTRWWYAKGDGQRGPFTSEELKKLAETGELDRADSVWREGESDRWPAASIKGLFEASQPTTELGHKLPCRQCGGAMQKTVISSGNFVGILGALVVFFFGLFFVVYFFLTIIGPIVGALMMIFALFMGGKRQRVWKCSSCGYYFVRA